jgi:hypothetical protein
MINFTRDQHLEQNILEYTRQELTQTNNSEADNFYIKQSLANKYWYFSCYPEYITGSIAQGLECR